VGRVPARFVAGTVRGLTGRAPIDQADMLVDMAGQPPSVTLREVVGDPEELRALQRVMESDEGFALRVTGHPPGPADAQSTLMFVPEGKSPDDKAPFGVWAGDELVGILDLLLRWPDEETVYIGLLLIDRARQGQGIGAAAYRALEREVLGRWPWARRLRLSVVRTNDQVLGFWRRMGFSETGEVRPWRYDRLESESILMDKPLAGGRASPRP
jgi:ribosomal protein S18 acetylase RimI-like enzyme